MECNFELFEFYGFDVLVWCEKYWEIFKKVCKWELLLLFEKLLKFRCKCKLRSNLFIFIDGI